MYPDRKNSRDLVLIARQRGLGLPATIFLISILAIIVVALSDLNQSSGMSFAQDFNSTKAFYAAESGAQVALNRVFVGGATCNSSLSDIDFDSSGINPGLNDCLAALGCSEVTVDGVAYYTVTSDATCGSGMDQSQRSIQVRARSN